MIYVIDRVENIVEKAENSGFQHYLLFTFSYKRVNTLQISPGIYLSAVCLLKLHGGKGEIAHNEQFLLPTVFPTCLEGFCHFHTILNCHLPTLSVWKSLKFVFVKG